MPQDVPIIEHTPAAGKAGEFVRFAGSKEVATLEVSGERFTNWTSVRVEQQIAEWFPTFQFESTEYAPVPLNVEDVRFLPGNPVRVYVGGVPAVNGYITERHVAYDAKQHAIRLIGTGDTFDLPTSSVPMDVVEQTHDGKSFVALAHALSAHLGIDIHTRGSVDNTPFKTIGIQPGETIAMALERYARMRNIVIGSNAQGGLVLIGENSSTQAGVLIEDTNILRANAVIRDTHLYKRIFAVAQEPGGSSGTGGAGGNHYKAELPGTHSRNRHMVAVCEVADTPRGVQRRCAMENVFTEGTEIEANITVQGWFKDSNRSNDIWKAGEYYHVDSPSLVLNGILGCAKCVYEQSDGGTTTTLNMVDPLHMNGQLNYRAAARTHQLQQAIESGRTLGIGSR